MKKVSYQESNLLKALKEAEIIKQIGETDKLIVI
jgi:hypothetical protein